MLCRHRCNDWCQLCQGYDTWHHSCDITVILSWHHTLTLWQTLCMGYIFCTKTYIMNPIIYFRVLTTFLCMLNWHHFSVITGLISLLMPFLLSLKYRSCNPLIHHVKPTLTCLMNVCTFCQMSVLLNNPGGMVNRLLNEFLSGSIVYFSCR